MTVTIENARETILQAAGRLVREGLIERTWGNISARVSDTQFLITPSGLGYENMTADQLVLVNIGDCSYEGDIKPSSEKGIHAGAYRLRPEVKFVIHTHQYWASLVGVPGRALTGFIHPMLGKRVPCAGYGLPGTKRLRKAVTEEIAAWPDAQAFLMHRHGALCLGKDMEGAFDAAQALEEVCEARVCEEMGGRRPLPTPPELGRSVRRGNNFILARGGVENTYYIHDDALPYPASLHAALYRAGDFQYAGQETSPEVMEVCIGEGRLRPYLDDLAQIAGADVLCVPVETKRIERAMRGRNAVLLRGAGALCAGNTESDMEAVRALLRKGCAAKLYALETGGCRPLGMVDAAFQRRMYTRSYSKLKDPC